MVGVSDILSRLTGRGGAPARDTILLFCVGATKSGTSWLHEALADHPQCHLRSVKELHYFDSLFKDKLSEQVAEISKWRDRLNDRLPGANRAKKASLTRRIQDRNDWLKVLELGHEDTDAYLSYLKAGQGAAHVIGDVTPAYALLPVDHLRAMAKLTDDVRFVYLMRDPVARLWSHVRMIAARRNDGVLEAARAANILQRTMDGKEREIELRGDYASALVRLGDAVPADKFMPVFFEEMIGGDGLSKICDFLDLSPIASEQARRVHAGAALDMPEALRDKAMEWLAPQYEHVAGRMGRLPDAWQANRVKV